MIPYVTTEIAGRLAWLDAAEALEAIEDGAERESQYPALDGEPFNGSILDVVRIHGACASDFAGKGPILAERFDVRDSDAPECDEWLHGPYFERAAPWPGVVGVRTFAATPDIPQRFPHTRYQGGGTGSSGPSSRTMPTCTSSLRAMP